MRNLAKEEAARYLAEQLREMQRQGSLEAERWEKSAIPEGLTAEMIDAEINKFLDAWVIYLESRRSVLWY